MASRGAKEFYRDLNRIAESGSAVGWSDAELLIRFAAHRGDVAEAAFEAIVARHGPMVLGVCRSVLRRPIDADDAFQATFLVLVKKASALRLADTLAPWLYRVALRVSVRARAVAQKRGGRETSIETADQLASDNDTDADALDVRPILFEELDRLPEKYRSPVVLCHLEGLSHEEAARRLQWPVGTLSGRLSRARGLLRSRLERRGLGASAAFGGAVLPTGRATIVPPALLRSTIQSASALTAGGPLPDSILSLYQGVVTAMLVHKIKSAAILGAILVTFAAAAGYASAQLGGKGGRRQVDRIEKRIEGPRARRIYSEAMIVVPANDRRSITAMVIDHGTWNEYRAPEGVSVSPEGGAGGVLALELSGDDLREIAAFATSSSTPGIAVNPRGQWVRQALRQPAKGKLSPVVSNHWAYYQVGSDFYAFSEARNAWNALHLDSAETPRLEYNEMSFILEQGETLYVFSVATGKWSKGLKVSSPEAG